MATFTVHHAKTHLSRLIADALAGEEVVIAPHGRAPAVRLVPAEPVRKKPLLGAMKGRITFDESFFDPLPDDYLGLSGDERD